MMRLLLPLVLALMGLGGGIGAGLLLRPAPPTEDVATDEGHPPAAHTAGGAGSGPDEQREYVKLNNQFIVPIVEGGRVASMVILSISLEVPQGAGEQVYAVEPKLRDGMLSVLFDHANAGGFDGSFTDAANLVTLRRALLEAAQSAMGPTARDILITDIMRQDG